MPPRMMGLFALAQMEREGAVHGYLLSQRIAEKTQGAWRPSPGTVYPCLKSLVDRGLARASGSGRRRPYRITPAGRAVLRRVRREVGAGKAGAPDLSVLWAEVAGEADLEAFLLRRLRRSLDAISAALVAAAASDRAGPASAALRRETIEVLSSRLEELRGRGAPAVPMVRARRGRAGG
jgi:DNA-binding PadR family transcriptional regulator